MEVLMFVDRGGQHSNDAPHTGHSFLRHHRLLTGGSLKIKHSVSRRKYPRFRLNAVPGTKREPRKPK